jgi:hypothetical protein
MPTVRAIIDWVDRKVHNSETDANKIIDLNGIQDEIFVRLSRLRHDHEIYTDTTVADQLSYNLPSNCTIDNIICIKVSTDSGATDWDTYEYAGLLTDTTTGKYYGIGTSSTYILLDDDAAISTAGLSIRIFYYKTPAALTAVTDTPELYSQYHNLLKYALCQSIASQGANPDTEIADYWEKKYNEFFDMVEANLTEKFNSAPATTTQLKEVW